MNSPLENLFRLDGKVALVTGGSSGIGYYAASALLCAGCAKVIITGRRPEKAQEAAAMLNRLRGIEGKAVAMVADASKTEEIERLTEEVKRETGGRLDILIPNAGTGISAPFATFEDSKTVEMLDVNVRGVFNVVRLMLPFLAAAGTPSDPARVIIVSSTGGLMVPQVGERSSIIYAVTKAGSQHMARNLALELASQHITTNSISPGYMLTEMTRHQIEAYGGLDAMGQTNPLGRLGSEEDIAGVVVYLCSKAGMYVNGADIPLDGGSRLRSGSYSC